MKRGVAGIATAGILAIGGLTTVTATASTPPPGPGAVEASSIPGCWRWKLESHMERRVVMHGEMRFTEFRPVATFVRWCPKGGYEIVTWRGQWRPGLR